VVRAHNIAGDGKAQTGARAVPFATVPEPLEHLLA
jgi:hypothetical protein